MFVIRYSVYSDWFAVVAHRGLEYEYGVLFPHHNVRYNVCSLSEIFLHRCELMVGTDALQSWQVIEFVKTLTEADSCSL
jgi:hypothetical protein